MQDEISICIAKRLAECALANTQREFSEASSRLGQLRLNGASRRTKRLVRDAEERALVAYLARRTAR